MEPTRKASIARPHCGPFKHKSWALGYELASGFQTRPLSHLRLVVDMSIFMHSGIWVTLNPGGWSGYISGAVYTAVLVTSHLVTPRPEFTSGDRRVKFILNFQVHDSTQGRHQNLNYSVEVGCVHKLHCIRTRDKRQNEVERQASGAGMMEYQGQKFFQLHVDCAWTEFSDENGEQTMSYVGTRAWISP